MAPTWESQHVRGLSTGCYYKAPEINDRAKCGALAKARDQYVAINGQDAVEQGRQRRRLRLPDHQHDQGCARRLRPRPHPAALRRGAARLPGLQRPRHRVRSRSPARPNTMHGATEMAVYEAQVDETLQDGQSRTAGRLLMGARPARVPRRRRVASAGSGADGRRPRRARGRDRRPDRTQRRRQVDADGVHLRLPAGQPRARSATAAHDLLARAPARTRRARHRPHAAERPAVPVPQVVDNVLRRAAPTSAHRRARPRPALRRRTREEPILERATSIVSLDRHGRVRREVRVASCPTARFACSSSAACWRSSRSCSCSTNRPRASARARPRRSARCCSTSRRRPAPPSSSSSTTCRSSRSLSDRVYCLDAGDEPQHRHARRSTRRPGRHRGLPRHAHEQTKVAARATTTTAPDADAEVLLDVEGIDVFFGKVQVLYGVDFEVRRGERVALLGTNGAGKSTILKAASRLVPTTAGTILWKGEDVTSASAGGAGARRPRPGARRPRAVPDAHGRREPPHGRLRAAPTNAASTRRSSASSSYFPWIPTAPTSSPARCRAASSSSSPSPGRCCRPARAADDRRAVARPRAGRHRPS